MKTTIDRAGRVVIPKPLREAAGIQPGAELNLECRDGRIEIEPLRHEVKMLRKGKRWVLAAPPGTPPLTNEQVLKLIRQDRERRL